MAGAALIQPVARIGAGLGQALEVRVVMAAAHRDEDTADERTEPPADRGFDGSRGARRLDRCAAGHDASAQAKDGVLASALIATP